MFVLNPDPYSLPCFRIGPFTTKDLSFNHNLYSDNNADNNSFDNYLHQRFKNPWQYTINGREGIYLSLKYYNLKATDLVTIITTSQNQYISSCVTKEIEKFCTWNREIVPETKVIFVNHEFGTVYPDMEELVATDIPIIEDCCTTFFSQDKKGMIGKYGDFAIYSFPKFFPIQIGGLLVINKHQDIDPSAISNEEILYIQKVLSWHISKKEELLEKRQTIYNYALEQYRALGFSPFFKLNDLQVPSVMMLKNNGIIKDLPGLKTHLWNHGIQSSVFYGKDAFFIPSHQCLTKTEILYFKEVINQAIEIKP